MMSNNDGGADGDDGENNDDDDDEEEEELPQHRPQTATTHVSTKVMCNSKFMELSGTLLSFVLLLHYFCCLLRTIAPAQAHVTSD